MPNTLTDLNWIMTGLNRIITGLSWIINGLNRIITGLKRIITGLSWILNDFNRIKTGFNPDYNWFKPDYNWINLDFITWLTCFQLTDWPLSRLEYWSVLSSSKNKHIPASTNNVRPKNLTYIQNLFILICEKYLNLSEISKKEI